MSNLKLRVILEHYIENFNELNITVDGCSFDDLVADFDYIETKTEIWDTGNINFADFAEARHAVESSKNSSMTCMKMLRKAYKKSKFITISHWQSRSLKMMLSSEMRLRKKP